MKGIEMFSKVDIPVLGIVENMSVHECPSCGHISHLFGADGGRRVADDLGVPLLGQLPLAMSIREQADSGQPTVKVEPDSQISGLYRDAARNMAAQLWGGNSASKAPTISMVDD
jgi:ATP-binding protein involved in chromosome partitioning